VILATTPEKVVQKYQSLIGTPVLIPQWGLGWNQCRYGYRSTEVLRSVLDGYRNNDFPLDIMWSDTDYMSDYRNFIYDSQLAFKGLDTFIGDLHSMGMRYVPILDAGTAARPLASNNYAAYMDGEAKGVFMKVNGETFIGQVWPNDAAFPDFFNDTAVQWWKDNLNSMHKLLPFDGLWLDMNEASNFCVGACYKR
jgi:alpha-D-xyloside xylohydrolase